MLCRVDISVQEKDAAPAQASARKYPKHNFYEYIPAHSLQSSPDADDIYVRFEMDHAIAFDYETKNYIVRYDEASFIALAASMEEK